MRGFVAAIGSCAGNLNVLCGLSASVQYTHWHLPYATMNLYSPSPEITLYLYGNHFDERMLASSRSDNLSGDDLIYFI